MRLTLFFLFFTQFIIAQDISGIILDSETNEPIENVTVYFEKKNTGTVSDANGAFNLTLKSKTSKTDRLEFSIIGYHSKTITISTFTKTNTTVYLSKKLENLDEVVVNSSKKLNSTIQFKRLKSLKTGVFAFDSQVVGNYIYVISGNSSYTEDTGKRALTAVSFMPRATLGDVIREFRRNYPFENYSENLQIYDIQNNKWSIAETKFRKRAYHNLNCYGNTLFSLGGKRLSINRKKEYLDDKIEVFDMGSKDIVIDHTNPHQGVNFASLTYEDNIIVMGGSTSKNKKGNKIYSDVSHIYNITSGHWYELQKMKTAKETQGVIIDKTVYLIGGYNEKALKDIESYDITTGIWKTEGELFYDMERPALTVHENIIYMYNENRLLTYDTTTHLLEAYKINLNIRHPKMHYHQNKLYVIGGYVENEYSKKALSSLYVINLDEFSKVRPVDSKIVN